MVNIKIKESHLNVRKDSDYMDPGSAQHKFVGVCVGVGGGVAGHFKPGFNDSQAPSLLDMSTFPFSNLHEVSAPDV